MKPVIEPIERKHLPEQISEQIISMIRTGKLKIGDKLPPEPVLMREFGVGRSSIREAIGALQMIGIVRVKQGKGTHVTAFPDNHIEIPLKWNKVKGHDKAQELIDARIALELAIVTLAARKATERDIDALRSAFAQLGSSKTNRKKFIQADQSFHLALAAASQNTILMRFYREIRHLIRIWRDLSTRLQSRHFAESVRDQGEILAAIEAKDVEKARQVMEKHLREIGYFTT